MKNRVRPRRLLLLPALLLVGAPFAHAQSNAVQSNAVQSNAAKRGGGPQASVQKRRERLGVGDVGAALLSEPEARSYRRAATSQAAMRAVAMRAVATRAAARREDEVTMAEFKRGALLGGVAGAAAGALLGAALGGGRNPRWETALPVAAAGLAVGAPVGVYVRTGQPSRYLWGTAGVAVAVAGGTAIYLAESR